MLPAEIRITGVPGLPEVKAGDSLGDLIATAIQSSAIGVCAGDILVIAHKVVSKAEGRIVQLDSVRPSQLARSWAQAQGRDPRVIEVVLSQTRRIVRMDQGHLIVENLQGFVCANAGVDTSNTAPGSVILLPQDPDSSAGRIRASLIQELGVELAVIVADTSGRPWRKGLVNVAVGVSGMAPVEDYRGRQDRFGKELKATVVARVDEVASAAELLMGKQRGVPVALVRGLRYSVGEGSAAQMIRPAEQDLFR
ncbi:MAG: coenzyme F420-0:L-glutamate ligase [Acidobacteriota bacterium]